jgi:hypothetical protein
MYRRALVTAALITTAVTAIWAAERATFVLTNGERKSGEVVFHGSQRANIIDNYLNLGNDAGGPEFTVPVDQVVVIDFAGGKPSQAEKDAVPTDSSQLLVLRNGETQKGRLGNLIGGDTLVWQSEGGGERRFPIRDVSRVYLNSKLAWTTFIGEEPPTRTQNSQSSGSVARAPGTVEVPGNVAWTDSGVTVRRGERVSFEASGSVDLLANSPAGPDGRSGMRSRDYPVPAVLGGALIGRVGNSRPFVIGSDSQPLVMPATGRLMLGVNDNNVVDNSGSFVVKINKN